MTWSTFKNKKAWAHGHIFCLKYFVVGEGIIPLERILDARSGRGKWGRSGSCVEKRIQIWPPGSLSEGHFVSFSSQMKNNTVKPFPSCDWFLYHVKFLEIKAFGSMEKKKEYVRCRLKKPHGTPPRVMCCMNVATLRLFLSCCCFRSAKSLTKLCKCVPYCPVPLQETSGYAWGQMCRESQALPLITYWVS